jgi:hypothetical protein
MGNEVTAPPRQLGGSEWSASCLGRFNTRKESGYPFNMELDGFRVGLDVSRNDKYLASAGLRAPYRLVDSLVTILTMEFGLILRCVDWSTFRRV